MNYNSISLSDVKNDISKQLPSIVIGSLTLVAGLAWNNAIQASINYYVPEKYRETNVVFAKICYAFILTMIIIAIIGIISKFKKNQ